VEAATILTGLASGTLLAAAVLALWDGFRPMPGIERAVQIVSWLAGALLLLGVLLAWLETHTLPALLLVAAVAAPQGLLRRPCWSNALPLLPPLALAGIGLFWTPTAGGGNALVVLAAAICAGLGARALGEALRALAGQIPAEWPGLATYALLTLLAAGLALANLAQRGTVWSGNAAESGLAAAWLAWSAAWFTPRERARLRAGMNVAAVVVLVIVAVGYQ
jgi:hypothetical protein